MQALRRGVPGLVLLAAVGGFLVANLEARAEPSAAPRLVQVSSGFFYSCGVLVVGAAVVLA